MAEDRGIVIGWTALAPTSNRDTYSGVGEVSTYIGAQAVGRGVGRTLLSRLMEEATGEGWWSFVAQIFPENVASIALHRACGFRTVGTRERLGRMSHGPMAGAWRDVTMLERRVG